MQQQQLLAKFHCGCGSTIIDADWNLGIHASTMKHTTWKHENPGQCVIEVHRVQLCEQPKHQRTQRRTQQRDDAVEKGRLRRQLRDSAAEEAGFQAMLANVVEYKRRHHAARVIQAAWRAVRRLVD
jgi:hypothetical protein